MPKQDQPQATMARTKVTSVVSAAKGMSGYFALWRSM